MTARPAACEAASMPHEEKVICMVTAIQNHFVVDSCQVMALKTPKVVFYELVRQDMRGCSLQKPGKWWESAVDDVPKVAIAGVDKVSQDESKPQSSRHTKGKTFRSVSLNDWFRVRSKHLTNYQRVWESNRDAIRRSRAVVVNFPPRALFYGSQPHKIPHCSNESNTCFQKSCFLFRNCAHIFRNLHL